MSVAERVIGVDDRDALGTRRVPCSGEARGALCERFEQALAVVVRERTERVDGEEAVTHAASYPMRATRRRRPVTRSSRHNINVSGATEKARSFSAPQRLGGTSSTSRSRAVGRRLTMRSHPPKQAILPRLTRPTMGKARAVSPSNEELADRLVLFATLLDLSGATTFSSRAYRRAADLIRDTPAPVSELVRAGRVRELRGIGPGIERRLSELVETGRLAELEELEAEIVPEIIGIGRSLGLSTQRILTITRSLALRSADDLRDAIMSGRVRSVPGVGPTTEKRLRAAIQRPPTPRAGLTLARSRPLSAAIASRLGGEIAGDARRYCELSYELAVVCFRRRRLR